MKSNCYLRSMHARNGPSLTQPPSRCNALRGGTKVLHAVPAASARPFGTPEFFLVRLTQSIPSAGILLSSRTFVGEKEARITNPLELDNVIWQKPLVDRLQIIHALLLHDVRIHLKRSHHNPHQTCFFARSEAGISHPHLNGSHPCYSTITSHRHLCHPVLCQAGSASRLLTISHEKVVYDPFDHLKQSLVYVVPCLQVHSCPSRDDSCASKRPN